MIRHSTLISFKEDATPEQKTEALNAFQQLPEHIRGILEFHVGLDLGLLEGNAGLSLQATFASREDFLDFSVHEAHGTVVFPACGHIMAGYSTAQFED